MFGHYWSFVVVVAILSWRQCTAQTCCPVGGFWGTWKITSQCTDTCGAFGTQTLQRVCLSEASCGPCTGPYQKVVRCNRTPCAYPRLSCFNGMKATVRNNKIVCVDPGEIIDPAPTPTGCCPLGGLMDYTDWTSCNGAKCGSCDVQTRQTVCITAAYGCGQCSQQEQVETRPCYTKPCKPPQRACCFGTGQAFNNQTLCF